MQHGKMRRLTWQANLRAAVIGALGLAILSAMPGRATCVDDVLVDVDTREDDDGVLIFVRPPKVLDATITTSLKLENLNSPLGTQFTLDLAQYTDRRQPFILEKAKVINPKLGYHYNLHFDYRVGNLNGRPDLMHVYQLPYRQGESHMVTQSYFGEFSHERGTDEEYAVDFDMPEGTPVLAARDGVVVEVSVVSNEGGVAEKYKKCRNEIAIRHDDGSYALYAHLKQNGATVRVGDRVPTGALIGYSGATGYCSGPHLHFCLVVSTSGTSCKSFPIIFRTRFGNLPKLEPNFVF